DVADAVTENGHLYGSYKTWAGGANRGGLVPPAQIRAVFLRSRTQDSATEVAWNPGKGALAEEARHSHRAAQRRRIP
ncbi:hypothetical protein ACWGN8_37190, partial [Streptomyces sp. NPDC055768]